MAKMTDKKRDLFNRYLGKLLHEEDFGNVLLDMTPSHVLKFAGEATSGGGSATESFSVPGVLASDIVHVTMHTDGAAPKTIIGSRAITDNVEVEFSADPSTDHVISYSVLRALS